MRIRPIEPRDRQRILDIVTATGNFTPVEIATAMEVVDEALADPAHPRGDYRAFVCEDEGGRVAGYECHGPTPLTEGTYDLYWIAVDPACQGSGFGRELLTFAEEDVRSTGGRLLLIETSSQESYGDTIRFYEKRGYPLEARIREFYKPGDDKLIFAKRLIDGVRGAAVIAALVLAAGTVRTAAAVPPAAGGGAIQIESASPRFGAVPKAPPAGPPPLPVALGPALSWRLVGPFRGGRALAVTGVPGEPETFFFGAVGGGVWRSGDAGRTWAPVFDGPPSGSIGAIAVAPSDPRVVYVGTGEADMRSDISFGDGMYRSRDGGRTFQPIGLADSRQIGRILVDPRNPDVVLVAALGHGFGPNPERGVFRSADGGATWQRVLHRDDDTGAIDLAADPAEPHTVYASLWNVRRPPWSTYAPHNGPGGGIWKSADGGLTWRELTGHGLPAGPYGRIGLAAAAGRPGETAGGRKTVYALIDDPHEPGLYRSDDGGGNWRHTGTDQRISSRPWYFGEVTVDPRDPETVYVPDVSLYRSTDGGRTFDAIKGAPGGDDYHSLWIDPGEPRRMILGSDQGAVVSVNGAATWSSWYNQPTAQIYHVAAGDGFPYLIYGAQQDSGTVATVTRSDAGQITFRDWFATGAGESGYILPDPGDPDVAYGGGTGGELYRCFRRTGQVQDVSPTPGGAGPGAPPGGYRYPWTAALAISPKAPYALYQGSQFVHRSTDHGHSWTVISPDLTVAATGAAPSGGDPAARGDGAGAAGRRGRGGAASAVEPDAGAGRGVIYSLAVSPLAPGQIWAGSDTGRIHLTRDDGASWQDVTPPALPPWSMVSVIEASPHDPGTAYVAIDRHQMDDLRPHVLRTHDFGATWTAIGAGIESLAATAYVHAVREDPQRRGLLFAATETGVFLSFDDGGHWQSLRLNLPAASVRDLAVHGDDLIAATHGRSFWVLDGIAPLRQLDAVVAAAPLRLLQPAPALRLRRGQNRDTPLPPETPAAPNPPSGALLDYWLAAEPAGDLTLEIYDARHELVRHFASNDPAPRPPGGQPFPDAWLRPQEPPGKHAGLNRFVWDLRYPPPPALRRQASMDAVFGQDTPLEPEGPMVPPGTYQVVARGAGFTVSAPLQVVEDPRVSAAPADLAAQLALSLRIGAALGESFEALATIRRLTARLDELAATPAAGAGRGGRGGRGGLPGAAVGLRRQLAALAGGETAFGAPPAERPTLADVHDRLAALAASVDMGDAAPTAQAVAAFDAGRGDLDLLLASWAALREGGVAALNRRLREAGREPLPTGGTAPP